MLSACTEARRAMLFRSMMVGRYVQTVTHLASHAWVQRACQASWAAASPQAPWGDPWILPWGALGDRRGQEGVGLWEGEAQGPCLLWHHSEEGHRGRPCCTA